MEKVYSKIDSSNLLHIINRKSDMLENPRTNISPSNELLQLRSISPKRGEKFDAHKHDAEKSIIGITQESLIIIQGSIKFICYDLDDKILKETILKQGDCFITFRGGHRIEILEDNTLIYEHKNGPYLGKDKDKILI